MMKEYKPPLHERLGQAPSSPLDKWPRKLPNGRVMGAVISVFIFLLSVLSYTFLSYPANGDNKQDSSEPPAIPQYYTYLTPDETNLTEGKYQILIINQPDGSPNAQQVTKWGFGKDTDGKPYIRQVYHLSLAVNSKGKAYDYLQIDADGSKKYQAEYITDRFSPLLLTQADPNPNLSLLRTLLKTQAVETISDKGNGSTTAHLYRINQALRESKKETLSKAHNILVNIIDTDTLHSETKTLVSKLIGEIDKKAQSAMTAAAANAKLTEVENEVHKLTGNIQKSTKSEELEEITKEIKALSDILEEDNLQNIADKTKYTSIKTAVDDLNKQVTKKRTEINNHTTQNTPSSPTDWSLRIILFSLIAAGLSYLAYLLWQKNEADRILKAKVVGDYMLSPPPRSSLISPQPQEVSTPTPQHPTSSPKSGLQEATDLKFTDNPPNEHDNEVDDMTRTELAQLVGQLVEQSLNEKFTSTMRKVEHRLLVLEQRSTYYREETQAEGTTQLRREFRKDLEQQREWVESGLRQVFMKATEKHEQSLSELRHELQQMKQVHATQPSQIVDITLPPNIQSVEPITPTKKGWFQKTEEAPTTGEAAEVAQLIEKLKSNLAIDKSSMTHDLRNIRDFQTLAFLLNIWIRKQEATDTYNMLDFVLKERSQGRLSLVLPERGEESYQQYNYRVKGKSPHGKLQIELIKPGIRLDGKDIVKAEVEVFT